MGKTHSKPLAARHDRGMACYVWIGLNTARASWSQRTLGHFRWLFASITLGDCLSAPG